MSDLLVSVRLMLSIPIASSGKGVGDGWVQVLVQGLELGYCLVGAQLLLQVRKRGLHFEHQ